MKRARRFSPKLPKELPNDCCLHHLAELAAASPIAPPPCCNSRQFKQGELRPLDGLYAMFFLHPIRCMFCWRRYYWFALRYEI